jgi:hypothetical protein
MLPQQSALVIFGRPMTFLEEFELQMGIGMPIS